jgi:hypothetical protein
MCKNKKKPSLVVLAVSGRALLQPKLLRNLRQKDLKLEASLGYTVGPYSPTIPKLKLLSKSREAYLLQTALQTLLLRSLNY